MSYSNIRKKLNKYAEGGKMIPKYQTPAGPIGTFNPNLIKNDLAMTYGLSMELSNTLYGLYANSIGDLTGMLDDGLSYDDIVNSFKSAGSNTSPTVNLVEGVDYGSPEAEERNALTLKRSPRMSRAAQRESILLSALDDADDAVNPEEAKINATNEYNAVEYERKAQNMQKATTAMGIVGSAVTQTLGAVDETLMGDKNFSALSQAIDSAVHGVSGALMKSGNPYAIAAGVAIEGMNFLTKAGGRTVPGFNVDVGSSGYGNIGHMESSSSRGLFGIDFGNTEAKLRKRNEQAKMALAAQDISLDLAFEQEARTNSVSNVLMANQQALAGGIDTSLLGN